jgi:hypothetical protein
MPHKKRRFIGTRRGGQTEPRKSVTKQRSPGKGDVEGFKGRVEKLGRARRLRASPTKTRSPRRREDVAGFKARVKKLAAAARKRRKK